MSKQSIHLKSSVCRCREGLHNHLHGVVAQPKTMRTRHHNRAQHVLHPRSWTPDKNLNKILQYILEDSWRWPHVSTESHLVPSQ